MQGRLYDPHIGRFITPDPYMQAPFWSQGLNRYSSWTAVVTEFGEPLFTHEEWVGTHSNG